MQERDAWKSIVAGAVAGLAASWVMNRYQEVQKKAVSQIKRSAQSEGERAMEEGHEAMRGPDPEQEGRDSGQQDERPTTVKVAEVISIKVAHRKLTERQQRIAEPVVHYAFGTLMGAWYGVLSAVTPVTTTGRGSLYGAAVWLGADEISLAAMGLAKNPLEYPVSSHLSALSAHLVYGLSLDAGRRALLKMMGAKSQESVDRSGIDLSYLQDLLAGEDWPSFRRRARHVAERAKSVYDKTASGRYGEAAKKAYREVKKHAA